VLEPSRQGSRRGWGGGGGHTSIPLLVLVACSVDLEEVASDQREVRALIETCRNQLQGIEEPEDEEEDRQTSGSEEGSTSGIRISLIIEAFVEWLEKEWRKG
jgi:hypothetical protein